MFLSAFLSTAILLIKQVGSQTIKALTIILSVCNAPPSLTFDQASNVLITNNNSVKNILYHCSPGKLQFQPTVFPTFIQIPCPENIGMCRDTYSIWADRTDDVIRRMFPINIDSYLYKIYVLPKGCFFTGLGTLGPCSVNSSCRVWIDGDVADNPMSYVHEIGHNLGLQHAKSNLNNVLNEYGDLSDFMGYCCTERCLNAVHSSKLGFSKAIHSLYYPFPLQQISLGKNEYITILDNMSIWYIQNRAGDQIDKVANTINIYSSDSSDSVLQSVLTYVGETFQSKFKVTVIKLSAEQSLVSISS